MANREQPKLKYYKGQYGDNWRRIREQFNMTVREFSKVVTMSYSSISKIENELAQPTMEQLYLYADQFNVSIDYLTGRTAVLDSDMRYICEYTGLSEKAIKNLKILNERNRATWEMNVTNDILSSKDFMELIFYATHALTEGDHEIEDGLFKTTKKILGKTQVASIFQTILDRISEKYESAPDYRFMYAIAYDLYDNGKLTEEQLEQVIKEYDQGNFDFDPRNESK